MPGEELPPGTAPALPLRCRWQTVALEDGTDGRVTEAMTEFDQFALNAAGAPARVLPREAQDEGLDLGGDGRAATLCWLPAASVVLEPVAKGQTGMTTQRMLEVASTGGGSPPGPGPPSTPAAGPGPL